MPVNQLLQLRRGAAATWTSANPVLSQGEPGFETDTGKQKIGDGSTAWSSLNYTGGSGNSGNFYNIRDYGAVSNNEALDAPAILAAKAAAEATGGTVYVPAASQPYHYNPQTRGVLAFGSGGRGIKLLGDDPEGSTILMAGTLRAANGRVGDSPCVTLGNVSDGVRSYLAQDITITGPSTTTAAQGFADAGMDGISLISRCELQRVSVRHCDAGIILNTGSGQQRLIDCINAFDYASLYLKTVGDDLMMLGCDFQNALFAGILSDDVQTDDLYSSSIIRSHFGFCPYGIYQAPGATSRVLTSAQLLQAKFEKCGNAGIYSNPGFASTTTAGTGATDIFDTTAPFTSGMTGSLVVWGGGLGYGVATFVSSSHITLGSVVGAVPAVTQAYSVASGTRSNANSGVLRDTFFTFPVYTTNAGSRVAAFPHDYDMRFGAISENNFLWFGHNSPATLDMDSFAGQTKVIAATAPTTSVAGTPATPVGWNANLNDLGLPLALTGAVAPVRWAGGVTAGPPVSGTFSAGDFVEDKTGIIWICTTGGSPGTWVIAAEQGDHPLNKYIALAGLLPGSVYRDTFTPTLGVLYLTKLWTPYGGTKPINNLEVMITTAGVTLTYAAMSIYDDAGNPLATSGDIHVAWNSGTVSAPRAVAMTSPATPPDSGKNAFVYAGFLMVGGTAAHMQSIGSPALIANGSQTAAQSLSWATQGSGLTTIPATAITLSSNVAQQPFYVAAY